MQAVSLIPAVFKTTKNSHKVDPAGQKPNTLNPHLVKQALQIHLRCKVYFSFGPRRTEAEYHRPELGDN